MGRSMKVPVATFHYLVMGFGVLFLRAGFYCLASGTCPLLTPDQRGYRHFAQERYAEASEHFADPMWKGVALFRQGRFKAAAGVFAGFDTADAAFNHGNALLMRGTYEEAAERYSRSLQLRPVFLPGV